MARPMPDPPPVITATWFAREDMGAIVNRISPPRNANCIPSSSPDSDPSIAFREELRVPA